MWPGVVRVGARSSIAAAWGVAVVGVQVRLVVQGIMVLLFLLVFSPRDVELRNI